MTEDQLKRATQLVARFYSKHTPSLYERYEAQVELAEMGVVLNTPLPGLIDDGA